jgi:hypothetical protein
MIIRCKFFGEALVMLLVALSMTAGAASAQTTSPPAKKKTTQTKKPPANPPKPDLEPKAIELLKAVSSRLAGAHTLSFTAVQIFESPSRQGPPLAYAKKTDVTLQRPAGVSLEGASIEPDEDANKHLYGKEVNAKDIIGSNPSPPTAAKQLVNLLDNTSPARKS